MTKKSFQAIALVISLLLSACGPSQYNTITGENAGDPLRVAGLPGVFWTSGRGGALPGEGFNLGRSTQIGPSSVVVTRNYNLDAITIGTPAIVNVNNTISVFVATSGGQLRSFNSLDPASLNPTGADPQWSATGLGDFFGSVSIGVEGHVFVAGSDGKLYSYDQNGNQRYAFSLSATQFYVAPTIAVDGTIYIGDIAGKVYSVSDNNGAPVVNWSHDFGEGAVKNEITVISDTVISLALSNGSATKIVGLNSGNDPAARVVWEYTAPSGAIRSPGAYYNVGSAATEVLVYGSNDRRIYAISSAGNPKWTYTLDHQALGAAAMAPNGDIYVISLAGTLYALTVNGELKWSENVGTISSFGPVIDADGTIFVVAEDKIVSVTDNGSSAIQNWSLSPDAGFAFTSSPTVSDGALFISQLNFAEGIVKLLGIYDI